MDVVENVSGHVPMPKPGGLVKANLDAIIGYCESDPSEVHRLLDPAYASETFGLNFPFWRVASEITPGGAEHSRYWTTVQTVGDLELRVTSQWYPKQVAPFLSYLVGKGIASSERAVAVAAAEVQAAELAVMGATKSKARFKGHAIGNAQNSFVRTLLSNLGDESFTKKDWEAVMESFGNRCGYCDEVRPLEMDHAIPINRVSLGEHRLGNLVPACRACNKAKGQLDFREYLDGRPDVIARIEAHMDRHRHVPLGDNRQIQVFLQSAYEEVGLLAQRYLLLLNTLSLEPVLADDA